MNLKFINRANKRFFISAILVVIFSLCSNDCVAQSSEWKKLSLSDKFERLLQNYDLELLMEDSLYISQEEKEWEALYQRRIDIYKEIIKEDDNIINSICDYYKHNTNIPTYQYDSLLNKTTQFYRHTQDAFITEQLVSYALPYYSKTNDLEHLFQCNSIVGLSLTQIAKEGDANAYFNALDYLNKAADFAYANYKNLKFSDSHDYLMRVYQELIHIRWLEQRKQTIVDSYDRYRELQDIRSWLENNPEAIYSVKTRKNINKVYFDFEYNMLDYLLSEKSQTQSNPVVKILTKFYKKHIDEESLLWEKTHQSKFKISDKERVQYCKILYYIGVNTSLQSFHAIDSIYQNLKQKEDIQPIMIDLIGFVNEAMNFLDITDELSAAEKDQYALSYLQDLQYYTKMARAVRRQSKLYDQLEAVVTNPHFYQHFSGDNRNDLLLNLLIKSDAEIYAHTTLVTWIGYNMMDVLIKEKTPLLVNLLDCNTEEMVIAHRDDFLSFFWNACLTHDLGLNRMSPTTNRHYRSLTSHELQLLRNHLSNGASIARIDSYHARFYDMIIGHHKWYNGKGFPESFDNVKSPYRTIIDLLSITDFIEGGSELPYEGSEGSFEERLEDLKQLSGTRFNPELVKMLLEHQGLLTRTAEICGEGQRQIRYSIYKEYFDENNSKQ